MICPKCNAEISDNTNFCPKCGAKIEYDDPVGGWYYIDEGKKYGPLSLDDIITDIENGYVIRSTPVWREGYQDFLPANRTELNKYIVQYSDTIPVEQISAKWLWALATVPFALNLIVFSITHETLAVNIVSFICNSILLILDIRQVDKSGIRLKNWIYLGFVFIPVYIFARPSMTTKKYGPAITWVIMFFVYVFLFSVINSYYLISGMLG